METGYYWIRYGKDSDWSVALWKNEPYPHWRFFFDKFEFTTSDQTSPYEINKTPIPQPTKI